MYTLQSLFGAIIAALMILNANIHPCKGHIMMPMTLTSACSVIEKHANVALLCLSYRNGHFLSFYSLKIGKSRLYSAVISSFYNGTKLGSVETPY